MPLNYRLLALHAGNTVARIDMYTMEAKKATGLDSKSHE